MKKSLNHWLTRDLTIFGRNILSKAECISKLIYPCNSLYISSKNINNANTNSTWFHIPWSLFKKIDGLDLILKCDFEVNKIPVKLSSLHKQILHFWKMIFTHNFSPHNSTLWNNRVKTLNRNQFSGRTGLTEKLYL